MTVDGEYKPGRVVVEMTDFKVPIAGLPITIGRRYDSLEKDKVGDFGHGWSLMIGHPRLEVDPALQRRDDDAQRPARDVRLRCTPVPRTDRSSIVIGFLLFAGYMPASPASSEH